MASHSRGNPEKARAGDRRRYHDNPTAHRTRERQRYQRFRKAIVAALGGRCVACGFADDRALQVDHVHGGGTREIRVTFSGRRDIAMKAVLVSALAGESKYQLLCANCNWIKRAENNETALKA